MIRKLGVLCALCCLSGGIASADGNTGMIYGRVLIARSNMPVCPITVTATSDREPMLKTHTDADGSFHFLSVFPGPVRITVGRSRAVRNITVSANLPDLELAVSPIFLPPARATYAGGAQGQEARRVCGRPGNYYTRYVFSDYDATQ